MRPASCLRGLFALGYTHYRRWGLVGPLLDPGEVWPPPPSLHLQDLLLRNYLCGSGRKPGPPKQLFRRRTKRDRLRKMRRTHSTTSVRPPSEPGGPPARGHHSTQYNSCIIALDVASTHPSHQGFLLSQRCTTTLYYNAVLHPLRNIGNALLHPPPSHIHKYVHPP